MRKKVLFIFNPIAGKAQIQEALTEILGIFARAGWDTVVLPTQGPEDAKRWTQERDAAYSLVVCCGGDGTLDEVASGMMAGNLPPVPVGYLPAGSTNDFARSLLIPTDLTEAAAAVVSGSPLSCDIGCMNGEDYFVYVAAFGIFTEVSYETPQDMKNALGHMAYILKGLQSLSNLHTYHVRVESEEMTFEDDFAIGMITNSRSVGGFKNITGKYVDLSDGLFEATFIKMPANPVELNQIIAALTSQDFDSRFLYHFQTSRLRVSSQEEIHWTRDGEYGGAHREVVLENRNRALTLIAPRSGLETE
ncbi:MAG: diacylglycerol kinase family lipid kinase [Eubacteriales bacterium]|nr:diacylglycerol kinase family lipid kinase [Eubacteriales bacterium]